MCMHLEETKTSWTGQDYTVCAQEYRAECLSDARIIRNLKG